MNTRTPLTASANSGLLPAKYSNFRMPNLSFFSSLALPAASSEIVMSWSAGSPSPFGHQRRGFFTVSAANSAGAKATVFVSDGPSETFFDTFTLSNATVTTPSSGFSERFRTGTFTQTVAVSSLGSLGRSVTTCGSSSFASPVADSVTLRQMPASRSRTPLSQSQPTEQPITGPSRRATPPQGPPVVPIVCSLGMPTVGCGEIRTAIEMSFPAFASPLFARSNERRLNAPVMRPVMRPFTQISAW